MTNVEADGPKSRSWIDDSALSSVLREFVEGVVKLTADDLIGIYLQGSLAQGAFDQGSDVDFLVVLRQDIPAREIDSLNDFHAKLFDGPSHWARHLEGSYAPVEALRRLAGRQSDPVGEERSDDWQDPEAWRTRPFGYPFWFLGNGSRKLVRSEHDNSQVMRWLVRSSGISLIGPPAETLIDPVEPGWLKLEVTEMLRSVVIELRSDPGWLTTLGGQSSAVLLFARAIQTSATGSVGSKHEAHDYAEAHLPFPWKGLVSDAYRVRRSLVRDDPDADRRAFEPTDAETLKATLAFAEWAASATKSGAINA